MPKAAVTRERIAMSAEFRKHMESMTATAGILKLLANPVRLCLLQKLLGEGELNVSQITSCMDVSQSAISQHLAKLRLNGIVEARKAGNQVFYACRRDDIRDIMAALFKEER